MSLCLGEEEVKGPTLMAGVWWACFLPWCLAGIGQLPSKMSYLVKVSFLGPLARDKQIFLGLFWYAPLVVSGFLASPAPRLGSGRQKENHETHFCIFSQIPRPQVGCLLSTSQVFLSQLILLELISCS